MRSGSSPLLKRVSAIRSRLPCIVDGSTPALRRRIVDIVVGLLCRFLCLGLAVGGRAQGLNGLPQAHRLTCRSGCRCCGRAVRSLCWGLSGYIESEAREADAQILTDVSRCDTLAEILESGAGLLCTHSSQILNLTG